MIKIRPLRGFFSAITLLALYALLVFLVIYLSGELFADYSTGGVTQERNLILLATLFLSLGILVIMIIQFIRLFRDQRKGQPGARIKGRFVLYFILIGALASFPQGILATHFIDRVFDSILGANLGNALEGSLSIALELNHERETTIRSIPRSQLMENYILPRIETQGKEMGALLLEAVSGISFIQVFDEKGQILINEGGERGKVNFSSIRNYTSGRRLPSITREEYTVKRFFTRLEFGGKTYLMLLGTTLPRDFNANVVDIQEANRAYLQLLNFKDQFRMSVNFFYIIFAMPVLLLSIFLSFLLTDRLLRPLINLEKATKRVAEGDFTTRILAPPKDVLANLVNSFNSMVEELQTSRVQILQTEKISTWQEIAQQLAHEIRNPLTPIKLSAQRILHRSQNNPEGLENVIETAVSAITTEVNKLDKMLKEFRDFARLPTAQKEWLNLQEILLESVKMYTSAHSELLIATDEIQNPLMVYGDRTQLSQVFTNLIKNAVEAMNYHGEIFIRTIEIVKGQTPYYRLQIQDTGEGISDEEKERVFNPYFTTKKLGTGLGLPIVERILFDHNGSIWFESKVGVGTTFYVDIKKEEK